jgi:23S rRNA pseudouridine2605 synthase
MQVRLNKLIAQAGLTSRRGGDRLIVDGHVAVNGAVTRSPATLADPELDTITVDGRRCRRPSRNAICSSTSRAAT